MTEMEQIYINDFLSELKKVNNLSSFANLDNQQAEIIASFVDLASDLHSEVVESFIDKIEEHKDEITELKNEIKELKEEKIYLENDVNTLNNEVNDLEMDIETLKE